jgi:hypothetical protein
MYYYLIALVQFLIQLFKKYRKTYFPVPPLPLKQEETQFEKTSKRYAEFYSKTTDDENSNIDAVLYEFDKRRELFEDPANFHEKQWKSRVLQENTPRGNVMMYYNPYSLSFVYHSDEQIIPYNILEQVAKKYVVIYRCKDFYIDMIARPDNKFLNVLQKEEDSLKSKKMKVDDITKCVTAAATTTNPIGSKDVFASLKDYRSTTNNAPPTTLSTPSVPSSTMLDKKKKTDGSVETKFSNKFVRIGKMCEFNILQKPPNKEVEKINELMFGKTTVNKVIDFFDDDDCDDLEIKDNDVSISSYKLFKMAHK